MSLNIHVRMFINMFNHVLVSTKRHKRFSPSLSRSTQVSEEHVVVQHTTHHDGTVSTRDANGRIHLCQALCVASLLLFFGAAVWCSERGRSRTSGATCRAHACSNHNAVEKNSRWHMRPFRQLAPWTFSWPGGPKKIVLGAFCLSVDSWRIGQLHSFPCWIIRTCQIAPRSWHTCRNRVAELSWSKRTQASCRSFISSK